MRIFIGWTKRSGLCDPTGHGQPPKNRLFQHAPGVLGFADTEAEGEADQGLFQVLADGHIDAARELAGRVALS